MKINPKHNKIVRDAACELRKVLVEQTIALMKMIGTEEGQTFLFEKTLILYQRGKNKLMETIIADRISYNDSGSAPYFLTEFCDENYFCSFNMSISNLQIIYNEVYKVVRKY